MRHVRPLPKLQRLQGRQQLRIGAVIVEKGSPMLCSDETRLAQNTQMEGHVGLGQIGGMKGLMFPLCACAHGA